MTIEGPVPYRQREVEALETIATAADTIADAFSRLVAVLEARNDDALAETAGGKE